MLRRRSVNPNNVNDIMNREAEADAGYKEPSALLVLSADIIKLHQIELRASHATNKTVEDPRKMKCPEKI